MTGLVINSTLPPPPTTTSSSPSFSPFALFAWRWQAGGKKPWPSRWNLPQCPADPAELKQICYRLRWQSCRVCLPKRRQSARPPETHNALAPTQKHQHSLPTMSPPTTRPYPPLPGKCDGGGVVGQLQHHLALSGRPGRWPGSSPGPVHRQLLGDVHGVPHPYSHSFSFL